LRPADGRRLHPAWLAYERRAGFFECCRQIAVCAIMGIETEADRRHRHLRLPHTLEQLGTIGNGADHDAAQPWPHRHRCRTPVVHHPRIAAAAQQHLIAIARSRELGAVDEAATSRFRGKIARNPRVQRFIAAQRDAEQTCKPPAAFLVAFDQDHVRRQAAESLVHDHVRGEAVLPLVGVGLARHDADADARAAGDDGPARVARDHRVQRRVGPGQLDALGLLEHELLHAHVTGAPRSEDHHGGKIARIVCQRSQERGGQMRLPVAVADDANRSCKHRRNDRRHRQAGYVAGQRVEKNTRAEQSGHAPAAHVERLIQRARVFRLGLDQFAQRLLADG
jgi:hypothetical protein